MNKPLQNIPLNQLDLQEDARPKAPPIGQGQPAPTQNGRHLRAIHRMHRQELSKSRQVLSFIKTGDAQPEALRDALAQMELSENMRIFGTLCGQECKMLNFHHDAEEGHMFPELEAAGNDALRAVVAKLRAEHEIVHELLRRLDIAAHDLVTNTNPETMAHAERVFDALDQVIQSHFSYEETELNDALDHLISHL